MFTIKSLTNADDLLTQVNELDDLSYILYHKSMNGLKNCIEISYFINEMYNNVIEQNDKCLANSERLKLEQLHREYQVFAIDAIVYFQAMIESDLNKWINEYNLKTGSFKQKWENIQKYFSIKSDYFYKWNKVYQQYRITFLHADNEKIEKNIVKFNDLTIYELYDSIKNGWFAFSEVLLETSDEGILLKNWDQNKHNQQIKDLEDGLLSFKAINKKLVSIVLKNV